MHINAQKHPTISSESYTLLLLENIVAILFLLEIYDLLLPSRHRVSLIDIGKKIVEIYLKLILLFFFHLSLSSE